MILGELSVWGYVVSISPTPLCFKSRESGSGASAHASPFQPRLTFLCSQAIGGAVWHGVKGFRNSPYGERRIGALTAIKARAPVLGGNFGVWGGLFSTFDCAVKGVRKKEDPYNASM
jgi:hypothetical protein